MRRTPSTVSAPFPSQSRTGPPIVVPDRTPVRRRSGPRRRCRAGAGTSSASTCADGQGLTEGPRRLRPTRPGALPALSRRSSGQPRVEPAGSHEYSSSRPGPPVARSRVRPVTVETSRGCPAGRSSMAASGTELPSAKPLEHPSSKPASGPESRHDGLPALAEVRMRFATTLLVPALWPVAATAGVFLVIHGDRGWCARRDRENAAIDAGTSRHAAATCIGTQPPAYGSPAASGDRGALRAVLHRVLNLADHGAGHQERPADLA